VPGGSLKLDGAQVSITGFRDADEAGSTNIGEGTTAADLKVGGNKSICVLDLSYRINYLFQKEHLIVYTGKIKSPQF
jgi:hypothetical protein